MWIDRNSWHWRVYQWWYNRKFPSRSYENAPWFKPLTSVNLCPYVRTILFWAPIRWLTIWGPRKLNVAVETVGWMGAYYLLTLVPVKSETDFGSLIGLTLVWGLLLVLRGTLFLKTHAVTFPSVPIPDSVIEKGASFFMLLGSYISKAHTQVCPQIELWNEKRDRSVRDAMDILKKL